VTLSVIFKQMREKRGRRRKIMSESNCCIIINTRRITKKSGVTLSTLLWKLSFGNQDTTHASLEDHKNLLLASTCVTRANLFSLFVYPGAHFSLLVYRSAHIYFSLNFVSLILNYFILAECIFYFQNWASTKHQILPYLNIIGSPYITNKKTRYVQS
jgi:hypothetical protein